MDWNNPHKYQNKVIKYINKYDWINRLTVGATAGPASRRHVKPSSCILPEQTIIHYSRNSRLKLHNTVYTLITNYNKRMENQIVILPMWILNQSDSSIKISFVNN